jgi:hypothetical protein
VDRNRWREVAPFIEKGGQTSIIDVLISNSLQHLAQANGRLAVIEAVTALDAALTNVLPRVIPRLPGAPQIKESQLKSLIEKAGLRIVATVGLQMIQTHAALEVEDIQTVDKAIEARNEFVHGGRRRGVDVMEAQKYVNAIRRIVSNFEQWVKG